NARRCGQRRGVPGVSGRLVHDRTGSAGRWRRGDVDRLSTASFTFPTPTRFTFRSSDMAKKETTYDEAQIAERLRELPGWYLEDGWIRRVYKTDGWPTTLMLVNAIGYLSEAAYH